MEILTLRNTHYTTCFNCDGTQQFLNVDLTNAGEILKMYCSKCEAEVSGKLEPSTIRDIQVKYSSLEETKNE